MRSYGEKKMKKLLLPHIAFNFSKFLNFLFTDPHKITVLILETSEMQ